MMTLSNLFVKPLALTALLAVPMTGTVVLAPTEAAAQKGGNGNGANRNREQRTDARGNNGRGSRSGDTERGNNGRGAIASELKGLNAAHASANARANASPDSMPGKLHTYEQAVLAEREYAVQLEEAEATYNALTAMTEEEFNALNPDLDYGETLAAQLAHYEALSEAEVIAGTSTADALAALTGGTELSEGATNELWRLLGLN